MQFDRESGFTRARSGWVGTDIHLVSREAE